MMTLALNKSKLDNLTSDIWKSAERLRGKFKAYRVFARQRQFWRFQLGLGNQECERPGPRPAMPVSRRVRRFGNCRQKACQRDVRARQHFSELAV